MGKQFVSRIDSRTTGLSGVLAGAFAAFMAIAPTNEAQAQGVHPEAPPSTMPSLGGYNLAPNAAQKRTLEEKDKNGENILSDYFQFVDVMTRAIGSMSCCHMKDGVVPMETEETGDPGFPYLVTYNQTRSGLRIAAPHTETVSAIAVLTAEHALDRCQPFIEAAEAQGVESTCIPSPFSIFWFADGTTYSPETGKHTILAAGDYPRMLVDSDYIITWEHYQELRKEYNSDYCFWPEPLSL